MPKRPGAYFRPQSLSEALQLLSRPGAAPLAGGTALLATDVDGDVVDLQALGLDTIGLLAPAEATAAPRLAVGAMTRLADLDDYLANQGRSEDPSALLRQAIRRAGPNTFRNAATLGGLVAGRPADSELLAALLVLEATLTIHRLDGANTVNLADYLANRSAPLGLITAIRIPWQSGQGEGERVARTPADYPIVSVTLWQPDGAPPRLAATGIGERPVRLATAEAALAAALDENTLIAAAEAARLSSRHRGDFRGDAEYRADMARVLTIRLLRPFVPT